jgi:hypothetical protein
MSATVWLIGQGKCNPNCLSIQHGWTIASFSFRFTAYLTEVFLSSRLSAVHGQSIAQRDPAVDELPAAIKEPQRVLHVHNGADVYGSGRSLWRLLEPIDPQRTASRIARLQRENQGIVPP